MADNDVVHFDKDTPKITDASKVKSVMAVNSETDQVGAVEMDLLVLEAGKKVGDAVKLVGNELPELGDVNKYVEVYGGANGRTLTYGDQEFTLDPNTTNKLFWDGVEKIWSVSEDAPLPQVEGTDELDPDGDGVPKEKATAKYVKPLYDLTVKSGNMSDNVFELGAWNAANGNSQTTTNAKRLPTIAITEDLVGQHWINGRGVLATDLAFVIIRTELSNPPVISIPGKASADDLEPITWTITPEMVGMMLRIGVGMMGGWEPENGYENTFTWNMGDAPLPSFVPKDKLTLKDVYSKADTKALISKKPNEVEPNGKIVRSQEKAEYITISGENFGNDSGYYVWSSGNLPGNLNGWRRKLFPIDGQSDYLITATLYSASNVAGEVFFDEEMNYLGYGDRTYPDGDIEVNRKPITYPNGTRFVGTSARNVGNDAVVEKVAKSGVFDKAIFDSDITIENDKVTKLLGHDLVSNSNRSNITSIEAFGDSTTQGADLPNMVEDRWTTLLQNKLDIPVINYGFSGARAEEITFWQGGLPVDITLSNVIIPANGTRVSINYTGSFNPFRASTVPSLDAYLILQDGTIVSGNLNRSTGFMQLGNTPINTGNGLVRLVSSKLQEHTSLNNLMMVSFGANNTTLIRNGEQTVDDLMKWYSDFAKQHSNVLIWSQNIRNAQELDICIELEDFLEKQFGTRFCNMRKYLASMKALEDAQIIQPGFVYMEADETAVENGLIPPSFKFVANSAHVNELGHKLQANKLFEHIQLYYL